MKFTKLSVYKFQPIFDIKLSVLIILTRLIFILD